MEILPPKEIFMSLTRNENKQRIAVQVAEAKVMKAIFAEKSMVEKFRLRTQQLTTRERTTRIMETLDWLVDNTDPTMTRQEFDVVARNAIKNNYNDIASDLCPNFQGILNESVKIVENGFLQIPEIVEIINRIDAMLLENAARSMNEVGGDLNELRQRGNAWALLGSTITTKNSLCPKDFDHGEIGTRYGLQCNSKLIWSTRLGVCAIEKIPDDSKCLHDGVIRRPWTEFFDSFLSLDLFEISTDSVVNFCHKLCDDPARALIEFNKRDGFRYERNGRLKSKPDLPSILLVSPGTEDGRNAITSACDENGDANIRAAINCVDLHRIGEDALYMTVTGVIDMVDHSKVVTMKNKKQYLSFLLTGAVGVDGESCAKLGKKICCITGKGFGSERTGWSSDAYPGRLAAEIGALMCLTYTTATPPCSNGYRLIHIDNVLEEGLKILRCVKVCPQNVTRIQFYDCLIIKYLGIRIQCSNPEELQSNDG